METLSILYYSGLENFVHEITNLRKLQNCRCYSTLGRAMHERLQLLKKWGVVSVRLRALFLESSFGFESLFWRIWGLVKYWLGAE